CLRKERERRYGTAEQLAQDLRRFLNGEPIEARPVGQLERFWRWGRRNPVGAALLMSLIIGTTIATALALWAIGERDRANHEAQTARSNETLAKQNEATAKQNEGLANDSAAEGRRLVCRMAVANGQREMDEGNFFRGQLWFAEPLARDSANREM